MRVRRACLTFAIVALGATLSASSRREALERALVPVPNIGYSGLLGGGPKADYPEPMRTLQYQDLMLPRAPVLHPYEPYGNNIRDHKAAGPQITFALKLPADFLEALPERLRTRIAQLALDPARVDLFCVVQDQPWTPATPMLFRPHYWAAPDAPNTGILNQSFQIRAELFDTPRGVRFLGLPARGALTAEISVHGPGRVVSSPNNLQVLDLDPAVSSSFWSLVSTGERAAATLHVLLNDADHAAMVTLAARATTPRAWIQDLDRPGQSLRSRAFVRELKHLAGPVIRKVASGDQADGSQLLLIEGSGFQDTRQVLLGGRAALSIQEHGDTHLRVVLPRTPSRQLSITTALGTSRPAPVADPVPAQGHGTTLWEGPAERTLITGKAGEVHEAQAFPCTPGETFVAEATVRSASPHPGYAGLRMRFNAPGPTGWDGTQPLTPDLGTEALGGPAAVAVQGTAPEGATQVYLYLRVWNSRPGTETEYQGIRLRRATAAPPPLPTTPPPPLPTTPPPPLPTTPPPPLPTPALPTPASPSLPVASPAPPLPPAPSQKAAGPVTPPPAVASPAVNLWQYATTQRLVKWQSMSASYPCVPGQRFHGSCRVRLGQVAQGAALIGLQFLKADGSPVTGNLLSPAQRGLATDPEWLSLDIRATAPDQATQVRCNLLTTLPPNASATFEAIVFQREP